MVLGEDGIIAQAKLAAERVKQAEDNAQSELVNLVEEISNILTSDSPTPTRPTATPSPTPTPTPTIKGAMTEGTSFAEKESKEITDGEKNMWVPQGYTVVDPTKNENVSYTNNNNPKIDEGIVITDKVDGEGKSTGNEFVWVPVENINSMVMCKDHAGSTITFEGEKFSCNGNGAGAHEPTNTQLVGKLYATTIGNSFTEETPNTTYNANSGHREPAIVTGDSNGNGKDYDANSSNLNEVVEGTVKTKEKFLEQLQGEFYDMAKSVAKYGGFYIGRYETSNLESTIRPLVKQGNKPTTGITWYTAYKNSKNVKKAGSGAKSGMIWGCQWDEVMHWFLRSPNPEARRYVKNSEDMGWFYDNANRIIKDTGTPITQGEDENKVNNIWDMAGNVWEWTMEAREAWQRIYRGGDSRNIRWELSRKLSKRLLS